MKSPNCPRLLLLLLLFFFSACDAGGAKDGEEPFGASAFAAEVTGDVNRILLGEALLVMSRDSSTTVDTFSLSLRSATEEALIDLSVYDGLRPGEGTYPIHLGGTKNPGEVTGIFRFRGSHFYSTDGTLTITHSSPTNLKGTFEMVISTITIGFVDPRTATIEGIFDAFGTETAGASAKHEVTKW